MAGSSPPRILTETRVAPSGGEDGRAPHPTISYHHALTKVPEDPHSNHESPSFASAKHGSTVLKFLTARFNGAMFCQIGQVFVHRRNAWNVSGQPPPLWNRIGQLTSCDLAGGSYFWRFEFVNHDFGFLGATGHRGRISLRQVLDHESPAYPRKRDWALMGIGFYAPRSDHCRAARTA